MKSYYNLSNLPNSNNRYIVVDTETTGVSQNDHLIELAAIEIVNGRLTGNQFHCFIKPRKEITYFAKQTHKMDNNFFFNHYEEFVNNSKSQMEGFLSFCRNSLIFAHNAPFDCTMINRELNFWGLNLIDQQRFRCTFRIFSKLIKDHKGASLVKCCQYFGMKVNLSLFHGALYDTLMCAKLLIKLFDHQNGEKVKVLGYKSYLNGPISIVQKRMPFENKCDFKMKIDPPEFYTENSISDNFNSFTPKKKDLKGNIHSNLYNNGDKFTISEEPPCEISSNELELLLGSELKNNFKSEIKLKPFEEFDNLCENIIDELGDIY